MRCEKGRRSGRETASSKRAQSRVWRSRGNRRNVSTDMACGVVDETCSGSRAHAMRQIITLGSKERVSRAGTTRHRGSGLTQEQRQSRPAAWQALGKGCTLDEDLAWDMCACLGVMARWSNPVIEARCRSSAVGMRFWVTVAKEATLRLVASPHGPRTSPELSQRFGMGSSCSGVEDRAADTAALRRVREIDPTDGGKVSESGHGSRFLGPRYARRCQHL